MKTMNKIEDFKKEESRCVLRKAEIIGKKEMIRT